MRIYLFAQHYPVPYKPYYDTQFVDLLEKGHDITIWAASGLDRVINEKVTRFGLLKRTRRYPTTLKSLPGFAGTLLARVARNPRWSLGVARIISARPESFKQRLMNLARAIVLGPERPDFCIVHELGTAVMFPFLGSIFPASATAVYYHGGETPIVTPLQKSNAANAFQAVDAVFSNTRFSCRHAIDRGCPEHKIEILPVGFAVEDFNPPQIRSYRYEGKLQLLSAGRMSEEKGFIYALRALRLLLDRGVTDIYYSLTGEGYLKAGLEEYVAQNRLQPYVRFLGTLSTQEVLDAMQRADVLLLPSLHLGNWAENQACAVQEAMLMKALVVTTATGGVPESIPQEFRQFSVPSSDAVALAEAIATIHAQDKRELERLGEIGRAFVLDGYDVRQLNDRLIEKTLAAHETRTGRARSTRPLPASCVSLS